MKSPARPSPKLPLDVPDPYDGSDRLTIPMPLSAEHDSDSVWQDFKTADEMLEFQFAKTDFTDIKDEKVETQFAKTDFIEILSKG